MASKSLSCFGVSKFFLLIDTSAYLTERSFFKRQNQTKPWDQIRSSATPVKKRRLSSCPMLWHFLAEISASYSLAFLTFPQKPKKNSSPGLCSAGAPAVCSRRNQRCFVIWNPLPVVHPDRFWLECSFVLSSKSRLFSNKPEIGFHPNQSLPFPICVFGSSMLPTLENYLIVYSQESCLCGGLSLCVYKIS